VADVEAYEVTCPHCGKAFTAEPLLVEGRPGGFKCPHCRLFTPYERAAERELVEPAD
jgi:tRNA(Ile2) C34 agmatinyltransferase TiaS